MAIGSLTSTTRSADKTAAAISRQDHGAAIWNRVFRSLATGEGLDLPDSARLLAMTNLAGADGAIGCWNDKYYWNFWRPITAIREAADDGNPATNPDPNWLPLFDPSVPVSGAALVTPGFPDHPSGHAGSAAHTPTPSGTSSHGPDRLHRHQQQVLARPLPQPHLRPVQ